MRDSENDYGRYGYEDEHRIAGDQPLLLGSDCTNLDYLLMTRVLLSPTQSWHLSLRALNVTGRWNMKNFCILFQSCPNLEVVFGWSGEWDGCPSDTGALVTALQPLRKLRYFGISFIIWTNENFAQFVENNGSTLRWIDLSGDWVDDRALDLVARQ